MEDYFKKLKEDLLKSGQENLKKQKDDELNFEIFKEKDPIKKKDLKDFQNFKWEQEKSMEEMRKKMWDDHFGRK